MEVIQLIIVICGPSGVGKTKLSIELAKYYNAIIVNCDATQVYKELNIGSSKIKESEKSNIPHYMLDIVSPNDEYNVYKYQLDARKILENNKDKNIIIVGGTGLYINALLYDYKFDKNNPTREKSNNQAKELYKAFYIGLTTDRKLLYNRINSRVDEMVNEGLISEVKKLYELYPYSKILHSAIGYKELIKYFDKEITLDDCIELIKKNTRNYAKRQYTWFNNKLNVEWFNVNYEDFNITIKEVIDYLNSK